MTFSTEIKIDQKGRGRQTFSKRKWANNRVRIQNSKYMSLKKRLRVVKPYKEFQVEKNRKLGRDHLMGTENIPGQGRAACW